MKYKYTIFLPVHNGGSYVQECVASILAQKYGEFDLVVLENASTDGTLDWLRTVDDHRLTVCRSDVLLPIEKNWGRAQAMPKNQFMTFISHDDILDPNYLMVMNALVRRDPDAGLYFAHFRYIDGVGKKIRSCRAIEERETVTDYMSQLFSHKRDTYGTGYLYRSKDYDSVGGMPAWNGLLFADDALWMSLMKGSWNATAREECFAVRVHKESSGQKASWRIWVEGMRNYHKFLTRLAKEDSTFSDELAKHAPKYFFDWANSLYRRLVEQANKSKQPIDPSDILVLEEIIKKTAPEFLPKLGSSPSDTRRRILKRFALTRWLYQWYRHLRYGETTD
jgi:glycosyltransferase involved in cell wall biosynthesis